MHRRLARLAPVIAFVPTLITAWGVRAAEPFDTAALAAAPDPVGIYGGQLAGACQWPSAVGIVGAQMQCTASLVHPEIVVTAGHCSEGGALTMVTFGEDVYTPTRTVGVASCTVHPNYALDYPDYADFMYCRLSEPVDDVPIVPPLMGCEADELVPGAPAVLAGYGVADDGDAGRKRWVTTSIESLYDSRVFFVGGTGKGTCNGDSGGPSYVQLHDGSWRVFGTTTGGPDCGDWGQSELIHHFAAWIEQDSGVDLTPCHDDAGAWAPTAACGGFPATPDQPGGDWTAMCDGASTPASETCGPAFDDGEGDDDGGDTGGHEPSDDDDTGSDDEDDDDTGTSTGDDGAVPPFTTTTPYPVDETERDVQGCGCAAGPAALGGTDTRAGVLGVVLLFGVRRRRARVSPAAAAAPSTAGGRS